MVFMILLCHSLFLLIHEASPLVFSMDILNLSTRRLVAYIQFSKAPSSSTLTYINGRFLFFTVGSNNLIIIIEGYLDEVGNIYIILIFSHTTFRMKLNTFLRVTLWKEDFSSLKVSDIKSCVCREIVLFAVKYIVNFASLVLSGQFFVIQVIF